MIPITSFADKKVAVFGLGGSGLVTAKALVAGGADVIAWDDNPDSVANAAASDVPTRDLHDIDFATLEALILSPGVPLTHPQPHWTVVKAKAAKIEIIGDIELFCRERRAVAPGATFIAITGTNGKSTTTALIAHLFKTDGWDVQLGGNIGTAILSLEPLDSDRVYVVECSSFQIDLTPSIDPTVGVLLNITEDHLDRHGSMERYAAIKARLVLGAQTAVIGIDDDWCTTIATDLDRARKPVERISVRRPVTNGFFADRGRIFEAENATVHQVADLDGIGSLRGLHNAQNAAAAIAAARVIGVAEPMIVKGLKSFPGLAHRMEEVTRIGKVLFVNDSKATNADAAEKALASFDHIYWIAGGKAKTSGITSLAPYFPKIAKAYLIGAAAEEFAKTLEGKVPVVMAGTMEAAVKAAASDAALDAAKESVVLLSPACASYDQYRNFEKRGDHFRDLVQALNPARTTVEVK
ncbi:UDP-N-acetylmuramoyl-L-alanine--D-glutamate ligase [Kaistia dalseonensis]|uniref:UDP-N-acetylmuramoylalanine--D-glutamate ligase n=1 Tax=Kaistia dalseonensis TaxID=410840 RepID=A0ABU0HBX8_9HYPH|nr:UDP-N-acetylmuramoyl-L-alanine--D-glutamate ligase [Kaistia dalseonensis]MCX5497143.1 UDP-N-acetylmuramoyl-L-alanine--D-glutamate ligase [Kaistia dalseonensis]MDQ0439770.1 UDP-N-acetylmuramoylalanine--D-glutamate ligase [Kaistia dalseonensis]